MRRVSPSHSRGCWLWSLWFLFLLLFDYFLNLLLFLISFPLLFNFSLFRRLCRLFLLWSWLSFLWLRFHIFGFLNLLLRFLLGFSIRLLLRFRLGKFLFFIIFLFRRLFLFNIFLYFNCRLSGFSFLR